MSTAILPAIITHQQLGTLIAVLRDHEQRRDVILISPEPDAWRERQREAGHLEHVVWGGTP